MSKSNNPAASRRGRDPNKESYWRKLVSLHRGSGLTIRAFCERESLKETTFHFWRQEIRRRDRQSPGKQTPALAFVEVHAASGAAIEPVEHACREPAEREVPLEVILPNDRRLLIRAGCDAALLARVVAVLAPVSLPALSLSKESNREGRPC